MIKTKRQKPSIYEKYRTILETPGLSEEEIDRMRKNVRLLAIAMTEHVLRKEIDKIY